MLATHSTRRGKAPQGERPRWTPDAGRPGVALVGPMGAGKSSVGRLLAERLGVPFVDLDEQLAREAGMTIAELFRDFGEVGFRARERHALREVLALREPMVLATGGGTFADASMREWLLREMRTVYLSARPETLFARVGAGEARAKRPLLRGPDPAKTLQRLVEQRRAAYEQSELIVNTEGRRLEQVADEVLRVLRAPPARVAVASEANTTSVRPVANATWLGGESPSLLVRSSTHAYEVTLREHAGPWMAERITQLASGDTVAVLSDSNVAPLHAAPLVAELERAGKRTSLHVVEPGESSKSFGVAEALYDALLDAGLDRSSALVSVGGGVVGDLGGFVASTLLRGITHVQVPTSTLAAVDASVGGKTGLNTQRGKNLVGTFYPPRAVLVCISHLATQARQAHAAGLAEVLKMGAALDRDLFAFVRAHATELLAFRPAELTHVLRRSVELKARVVSDDEREQGTRVVLNYGHTLGHALESGSGYTLSHGEAVGLGMVAEAEWAEGCGRSQGVVAELRSALVALGLSVEWRGRPLDLEALRLDKKRTADSIRMPVVTAIGTYELVPVPLAVLVEYAT